MTLPKDRVSRIIFIGFVAVIVGLAAFCMWAGNYMRRQEIELAQTVLRREAETSAGAVRRCLLTEDGGLNFEKHWHGSADEPGGLRGYNHLADLGVVIHDDYDRVRVEFTTARGRALRPAEMAVINRCL